MTHPALISLNEAWAKLEADAAKIEGQEKRLEQLKRNEAELLLKVNEAASHVAELQHAKANAETTNKALLDAAHREASTIVASASNARNDTLTAAKTEAKRIVDEARATAGKILADADEAVRPLREEHNTLMSASAAAKQKLEEMKTAARVFLGE